LKRFIHHTTLGIVLAVTTARGGFAAPPAAPPGPAPAPPSSPAPATEPPSVVGGRWSVVGRPAATPLARQRSTISGLLTVERAVEVALRESPVVRGAVEEVNVAVEELRAAEAQRRPILSTSSFLSTGTNGSIATTPAPVMPQMTMGLPRSGFYDQNLSVMVPLYTGGRLQSLVRRAEAARRASSAELAEVKLEVALLVRVAYRRAQVRQAFLAVYQELTRTNEERLRIDRVAFTEGRIAQYTVLRDEAEVADANQQLTNMQRDTEIARVELETVMGVNFGTDVSLESTVPFRPSQEVLAEFRVAAALPAPQGAVSARPAAEDRERARERDGGAEGVGPVPGESVSETAVGSLAPSLSSSRALSLAATPEINDLLLVAEQRRPLLEAQRFRIQSARQGIGVARSAYRPQVSLFAMGDAMQGRDIDSSRGYTAGLAVGLPILDGGLRRADLRRAEAKQRRQEQELENAALQVKQEVTTHWLALRAAERNVATAQAGARSGEEDYRIAQIRYAEGKSINVEALDALFAWTRARVNLAQAQFDYQVAADQLRRSLGLP
jgi:outer membrane protein TolC